MTKATLAAQASSGIAVLALLSALAQADSVQKSDLRALEFDMTRAALAASTAVAGDIIEAELEIENNHAIWEIDIVNETNQVITVEIDGQTGQILSSKNDDDMEFRHADALSLTTAIDIVKAVEQGALIEAELEQEDGQLIWEIETLENNNQETTFRIHAETGEILI